ncbi:MAG: tetratricopeptide repeat protein, partial [Myxococcota bacterium]
VDVHELGTADGLARQARLEVELPNLLVAIRYAETGAVAAAVTRAAVALLLFRGPVQQARATLEHTLPRSDLSVDDRAGLHWLSGRVALVAADDRAAEGAFEQARSSATWEGRANCWLARLRYRQGRHDEARALLEAALSQVRASGDRLLEGIVLDGLGLAEVQGSEEARAWLEQALAIHRQVGNVAFEGRTATNLGRQWAWRDPERERAYYQLALECAERIGNRRSVLVVRVNIGVSFREDGRFDEAREQFEAAIALSRTIGVPYQTVFALGQLADLEALRGDWPAALEALRRGIELDDAIGRPLRGPLLDSLGQAELRLGRPEAARATLMASLSHRTTSGQTDRSPASLTRLAEVELALGRLDQAREHVDRARLEGVPTPAQAAELAAAEAEARARAGQLDAATRVLTEAQAVLDDNPSALPRTVRLRGLVLARAQLRDRLLGAVSAKVLEAELDRLSELMFPGHREEVEAVRQRLA